MAITFCLCEDRELEEFGLRIALCSIRRHCPDARVVLYRPRPRPELEEWLRGFPNVTLVPSSPPGANSWNCKPQAMIPLLENGHREVVWFDSDAVLARDCRLLFAAARPRDLGAAQEYLCSANQGTAIRTRAWGLSVGREFTRTLNSCVLRVTPEHLPLLYRWQELLSDATYQSYQVRPLEERPIHMWGDQDVLNALIGSTEFADIDVHWLRTGIHVVHCSSATSYSFMERIRGFLRGMPPIVHCQGGKPWWVFDERALQTNRGFFWTYFRLIHELSPYLKVARSFRAEIQMPCPWMDYRSVMGTALRWLALGHFSLQGMPLCTAASVIKAMRPS